MVEQAKSNVTAKNKYSDTPLDLADFNEKDRSVPKYLRCIDNLPKSHFSPDGVLQQNTSACDDDKI